MLERILSLLTGYGFGCILTAEIVSYAKSRKSIRTMGSGNPGMTNALRIYGTKSGIIVLLGDLLKTVAACTAAQLLFNLPDHLAVLYAGLGTVLGHNFPLWNGFHGGKGVACTCMALFCFSPLWGLLSCLIGLAACLITHYLAIGGPLIPGSFLFFSLFLYSRREIHFLCLIIFLLMLERSFGALMRVLQGTEEKALWSGSPKTKNKS